MTDKENQAFDLSKFDEKKAQRYDRQIRIWGEKLQKKIQKTTIYAFGCDSFAIEALKNLVLMGVKQIILHDERTVSDFMIESNCLYFPPKSKNYPVASTISKYLQSLNPMVEFLCINDLEVSNLSLELVETIDFALSSLKDFSKTPEFISNIFDATPNLILSNIGEYGFLAVDLKIANVPQKFIPKPKVCIDVSISSSDEENDEKCCPKISKTSQNINSNQEIIIEDDIDAEKLIPIKYDNIKHTLKQLFENKLEKIDPRCRELVQKIRKTNNESRIVSLQSAATASVVGGIAAKEIISYFGQDSSPLNNILIYDPEKATANCFKV